MGKYIKLIDEEVNNDSSTDKKIQEILSRKPIYKNVDKYQIIDKPDNVNVNTNVKQNDKTFSFAIKYKNTNKNTNKNSYKNSFSYDVEYSLENGNTHLDE